MILNKPYTNKQKADFVVIANAHGMSIEDKGDFLIATTPTPLTQTQQAANLSMTKAEFLILVTGLTKSFETPITLEAIEAMLATNADIRMRFTYANTVERNHPLLESVSSQFRVSAEILDIMFINKDDLIYKIDNNLPLE